MTARPEPGTDVVIVGAGPAGTSAAAVLAQAGHRVTILERERFPRYRIGESLIPHCWFPLHRIGALDRIRDSDFAVPKHSVQFVSTDGSATVPFYFADHTDHECATTWQVRRAQFDQALLDNALERGAEVRMQVNARELIVEHDTVAGVRATTPDDDTVEFPARMAIDASGRDLFSVSRSDWRVADPHLRKIAIWTYYRGSQRAEGRDAGATTVAYLPDKGWFWHIPLTDDEVSVGIVAEREYLYRDGRDLEAIFDREVAAQPWIASRLARGVRSAPIRVTGDYSYRSEFCARDGLVLIGDAFAFLDPVFSSGVYLALYSGVMAGEAVDTALRDGAIGADRFVDYAERLCRSIDSMRNLVFAFYDTSFSFGKLIKGHPDLRPDLTECLIGNLERDFSELFTAIGRTADLPAPLTHGRPRTLARQ